MRRKKISILVAILIMLFCFGCTSDETYQISLDEVQSEEAEQTEEGKATQEDSIFVYVCGAVQQEGVYELPAGSRVYQAIEKAGGFLENAAITQINQAEVLEDEAQIYVPTVDELAEIQAEEDGKVNLNTASKEELMTLPGVGEAKANSIIQYREEQGKFQTIEDVMQISGIKEGLFEKIKDYITV